MSPPLQATASLPAPAMAVVRQRAIFECCKWDPQVGDTSVLADFALTLSAETWRELSTLGEALYAETLAAEREIAARPELIRLLALPAPLERVLLARAATPLPPGPRVMRFDFHPTAAGWAVSEVNSDVPGGYIEASGFARLVAAHCPGCALAADPVEVLLATVRAAVPPRARVGLVHATAYTDDRQVMEYFRRRLSAIDLDGVLLAPDALVWDRGTAALPGQPPFGALLRFFPVEWLPNLSGSLWKNFFAPGPTLQLNPATSALTQSKRFPLVWPFLRTSTATWRRSAPATVPWSPDLDDSWVSKSAFGRVGDGIGLAGATTETEWREIRRARRRRPREWVAQRRFVSLPCATPDGPHHVCLGVYVVAGRCAGLYGRLARRPLIDQQARDVALLLRESDLVSNPA